MATGNLESRRFSNSGAWLISSGVLAGFASTADRAGLFDRTSLFGNLDAGLFCKGRPLFLLTRSSVAQQVESANRANLVAMGRMRRI